MKIITWRDFVVETRPDGKKIARYYCDPRETDFVFAVTQTEMREKLGVERVTVFGGAGNQRLEKTADSGMFQLYGDNGETGFGARAIGPRKAGGDDRIDFGAGDWVKSGDGADIYRPHGPGGERALLWFNPEEDKVVAPARGYEIDGFRFINIKKNGDLREAELAEVTIVMRNPGPFDKMAFTLMLGDRRSSAEVDNEAVILGWDVGERGSKHAAVVDFVKEGHDGIGHDWLDY